PDLREKHNKAEVYERGLQRRRQRGPAQAAITSMSRNQHEQKPNRFALLGVTFHLQLVSCSEIQHARQWDQSFFLQLGIHLDLLIAPLQDLREVFKAIHCHPRTVGATTTGCPIASRWSLNQY